MDMLLGLDMLKRHQVRLMLLGGDALAAVAGFLHSRKGAATSALASGCAVSAPVASKRGCCCVALAFPSGVFVFRSLEDSGLGRLGSCRGFLNHGSHNRMLCGSSFHPCLISQTADPESPNPPTPTLVLFTTQ